MPTVNQESSRPQTGRGSSIKAANSRWPDQSPAGSAHAVFRRAGLVFASSLQTEVLFAASSIAYDRNRSGRLCRARADYRASLMSA